MNDLHYLIKSLNTSEKRYVVMYINRFSSKQNNYSILYTQIEKQTVYDEESLKKKLRRESFVKHLSVTKHYLFDLILNAIRDYYGEQFIDYKLKKQVAQIFVLSSKGLDIAAHKLVLKTKKDCWQYENYPLLLEVLQHERWLFGNRRIVTTNKELGILICEEEIKVNSIIHELLIYKKIWHVLNYYELEQCNYSKEDFIKHIKSALNPKELGKPNSTSLLLNAQYYNTLAHYYLLIEDTRNHFLSNKKVIEIREKQVQSQPESPIDLLATYFNFMLSCYQDKQWDDLKIYLQKIQKIEHNSIEKKIKLFHDYYYCALLYYLGTEDYKNGYPLLREIESGIEIYNNKIRSDFYVWLCQCSGLMCFFNKKYKEAFTWWQKISLSGDIQVEIKKQCSIELYFLMLAVEEDNLEVLNYQIKQTENKLKNHQLIGEAEKQLILFFKFVFKNGIPTKKEFSLILKLLLDLIAENKSNIIDEFLIKWLQNKAK